jgi:hypothetical protein
MDLTFELAHFEVREGEEAALLAERPAMVLALRRAFPGALATWLTKHDDGSWLDIVLWESREAAEDAAQRIHELPEARSWFRHIGEPHGSVTSRWSTPIRADAMDSRPRPDLYPQRDP